MFVLITIAKRNEKIAIKHPHGMNRRLSIANKNLTGIRVIYLLLYFRFNLCKVIIAEKQTEKQALLKKLINRNSESSKMNNTELASIDETSQMSSATSFNDLSAYYFTYDYGNLH